MDEINMLNSVIDIVIGASGLMLTDDFRISQKDGAANIVTSSDIAVQEFLCPVAVSCARRKICTTSCTNTHGLSTL